MTAVPAEADFVLTNSAWIATLRGPLPRTGGALRDLGRVERGALAARQGRVVWVGPEAELLAGVRLLPGARRLDAGGGAVLPGLVDAHTHLCFAGTRDDEIARRLAGATYAQIAAEGGGIVRTVSATRAASEEELEAGLLQRLDEALCCGSTTLEVKSGYGLETAAELRSLRAIRAAAARHPATLVPTFLGAHEVPVEHRADRARYLELLLSEMLPEVARQGLAAYCDVFCEQGVFTVDESRRLLNRARDLGLSLRLHADELCWTGGAELAAELRARSADHLIFVSGAGMQGLADSGCAATLLPAAAFYLRLPRYAPARALIDSGAPLALASDANPGGGLSPSLPFAMTVACFAMGLSLEEAVSAATIGGAWSLGLEREVGSLEPGKRADLLVLRGARLLDLVRVGVPAIRVVVKDGRVAAEDGRRVA